MIQSKKIISKSNKMINRLDNILIEKYKKYKGYILNENIEDEFTPEILHKTSGFPHHNNNDDLFRNDRINLNNDNLISFNNIPKEESIIIPWLKKEKVTEEIKRKYQDENCPICLEEINGDITITKCKHIFHYKCLAQNIKKYEKTECPICRSDVKTGRKKEVVNRVNQIIRNDDDFLANQVYLLNMFSNNESYQRNQINNNFENNNIRLSQQRINSNSNNNSNNSRSCFINFISNIFNMIRSCF